MPCLDCGRPGHSRRCPNCARAVDRRRGSTAARGYGADHRSLRAEWQAVIDSGEIVVCWRPGCRAVITGRAWHLGHDDEDRTITRGPECVACNLHHAGKAAHK